MKVILDCNIWISFLIGHQTQLMKRILTDIRFDVYVCDELLSEINDVAHRSKIQKYVSEKDITDLFRLIRAYCQFTDIKVKAQSDIRDPKDLYLLSLAESINATYIVSGDDDLLVLGSHKSTKMIKFADFKAAMMYE